LGGLFYFNNFFEVILIGIDKVQEWLDSGNVVIINGQLFRKSDLKELQNQKSILERRKAQREKELTELGNKNLAVDDELSVGQELGEHEPIENTPEEVEVEETEETDEVETEASEEEEEEEIETTPDDTKEEEEEELEIITIDDIDYCTNNEENGFIWELNEDGEQGDKIGYLKDGEPFFYADEN
jgi:hypothetical protein